MPLNLRILDAPDAVSYLSDVRAYLEEDVPSFRVVLQQLTYILDGESSDPSFARAVVTIARILRDNPQLFNGINALLRNGDRVECPSVNDPGGQVTMFVLVTACSSARIWFVDDSEHPSLKRIPWTIAELLEVLAEPGAWRDLIATRGIGKAYLMCLSQLLQVLLDDDDLEGGAGCKAMVYRCLRDLGDVHSILPPSMFLNHVRHEGDAALQAKQGGASSDIYLSVIKGTPICFRVLRMYDVPEEERAQLYKKFCKEVLVWRQLKHPNVLSFLGANTESFKPRFCFISYWMNHGSIMAYLKKNPEHDRLSAVNDIVCGIDYLHHLDPPVTHNDLKGANILVTDELTCCLADFGLSSILESQRMGNKSRSFGGSVCWMAPELMTYGEVRSPGGSEIASRLDMKAGDVFALGCTIYEIYTGHPPHHDCPNLATVICKVAFEKKRPYIPPATPPPNLWRGASTHLAHDSKARGWAVWEVDLWWLVQQCWAHEASERPAIALIKENVEELLRTERKALRKGVVRKRTRDSVILKGPMPSKVLSGGECVDREVVEMGERVKACEWVRKELGRGKPLRLEVPQHPLLDRTSNKNFPVEVHTGYPTPTTPTSQNSRGNKEKDEPMLPEITEAVPKGPRGKVNQWTLARPPSPHPRIIALKSPLGQVGRGQSGLPSPPPTPSNTEFEFNKRLGIPHVRLTDPPPLPPPPPTVPNGGRNILFDLNIDRRWPTRRSSEHPKRNMREEKPRRPAHLRYAVLIESDYEIM